LTLLVAGCGHKPTPLPETPMPEGARFEGAWSSNWGTMKLQRRSNRIWGNFDTRGGTIWGEAEGAVYRFGWKHMETLRSGMGLSMSRRACHQRFIRGNL